MTMPITKPGEPGLKGDLAVPLSALPEGESDDTAPSAGHARDTAGEFKKSLPWVILVSMMFLLTYLDRAMFGPMLSALEKEFHISHAASTRFLLYISVGYSASMFLSGFSSSRVRPRMLVSGSLIGCGLVLLAIAMTTSTALLSVLFALLGIAAAQYFNGGLSTMRSLVKPIDWSKAISIHEVGPNASFFIGPVLAEVGAAFLGWRGVVTGMGWISIAAGLFFYFFAKGGDYPATPVSFKGVKALLKEPGLWLFTWLMGLAISGEFAPYSVLGLHMENERALSGETAAFLLSLSRITAPFAVLCGGFATTRFGTRRTLAVCFAAYAAGMFLMALPTFSFFVVGIFMQPVMTAMAFPPVFTMLAETFPEKTQPLLLAVGMPVASFMGVGFMPFILGLWGEYVSFSAGFIMMGCLVALSFPLLRLMPEK